MPSNFFHHLVAQHSSFPALNAVAKFWCDHDQWRHHIQVGYENFVIIMINNESYTV